jgi:DNA invertase Pin-like site-specific DNA recombinase
MRAEPILKAVEKAMDQNMPKDTVERAIKRGSGELEGVVYEEIRYEGYGPGGVAVIVDCMTDNRVRTVADVRHAFSKHGGNLGTDGSVAYLFKHVGLFLFGPGTNEDALMEAALEAGADDVITHDDGSLEVFCSPYEYVNVKEALEKAGCERIYEDTISGTRAERPGLTKALEMLRSGDTLVVWKLDRLGRSVKQLVDLVSELHKRGVQFKSLTDAIDTGTPSGRFFFHVMASLAEMERELVVERTKAGLSAARQLGRKGGRKPKMTDSKIEAAKKLLSSGLPPKDVAKDLGVSIPTLYRWLPASAHA